MKTDLNSLSTASPSQAYTDLNSLNDLKRRAQQKDDSALKDVSKQFEQLMLSMMMKSVRDANATLSSEDDVFNSSQVQFYQGMFDQQMTLDLANRGGIGLAEVIERQLSKDYSHSIISKRSDDDQEKLIKVDPKSLQAMLDKEVHRVMNHVDVALPTAVTAAGRIEPMVTGKNDNSQEADTAEVANVDASRFAAQAQQSADQSDGLALGTRRFETPQEFVEAVMPLAEKASKALGVDPRVLVAQSALETGWGKHIIRDQEGVSSNNLFNIKSGRSWDGSSVSVNTLEYVDGLAKQERAPFRAYSDMDSSFDDYVRLIQNSDRYQTAREAVQNPSSYLHALQDAGYATDPQYANKVENIMGRLNQILLAATDKTTQEG